eukprot:m.18284 g.18284  ORF g.18284 m.18284 type:complete len:67 (-) comp11418_c0_seq1:25-225(-)
MRLVARALRYRCPPRVLRYVQSIWACAWCCVLVTNVIVVCDVRQCPIAIARCLPTDAMCVCVPCFL